MHADCEAPTLPVHTSVLGPGGTCCSCTVQSGASTYGSAIPGIRNKQNDGYQIATGATGKNEAKRLSRTLGVPLLPCPGATSSKAATRNELPGAPISRISSRH